MSHRDTDRDRILRFLYERHLNSRGIKKIPIGIRDLQSAMKRDCGMTQQQTSSNLDYLVQVGWVREVVKERSFKTDGGMEVSREQITYKISDVGINHMESGTIFGKQEASQSVNITNIQGVTIVGDGNIVNADYTDLSRALDELDSAIAESQELEDVEKLDASGDVSTIRTQIAKKNPNRTIISMAWDSLQAIINLSSIMDAADKVRSHIASLVARIG